MRNPFRKEVERSDAQISLNEWIEMLTTFSYQGVRYTLPGAKQEEIAGNYVSLTRSAYKSSGVVFACMLVRQLLFSEARFQFRQKFDVQPGGKRDAGEELRVTAPGALFGTPALEPLELPWPGATTGDLLTRILMDADLAGNAFILSQGPGVRLLRPDWVQIVIGSMRDDAVGAWDPSAEVLGYTYQPGGPGGGQDLVFYDASQVAHYAPIPDPEAQFRGMSWLTPIAREIMADKAATDHKLQFFENGASPNMVVKLDLDDLEEMREWIREFSKDHDGHQNAYRTMYLGAGADVTVVGKDLQQLDFKAVQGAGETRVAAAAGVPPVIVGLSEGLQAATYSNYASARRRFADGTMRPLWRNLCGSLAPIISVPLGTELWYDDRDIAFLKEDMKDAAAICAMQMVAIRTGVDGGFEPATVVDAITAGDLTRLKHTGLVSVQLQPPGVAADPAIPAHGDGGGGNGNGNGSKAQKALNGTGKSKVMTGEAAREAIEGILELAAPPLDKPPEQP